MHYEETMDGAPGTHSGAEAEEVAAEQALEDLRKNRQHLARVWERSSRLLRRAVALDRRAEDGAAEVSESRPSRYSADSRE